MKPRFINKINIKYNLNYFIKNFLLILLLNFSLIPFIHAQSRVSGTFQYGPNSGVGNHYTEVNWTFKYNMAIENGWVVLNAYDIDIRPSVTSMYRYNGKNISRGQYGSRAPQLEPCGVNIEVYLSYRGKSYPTFIHFNCDGSTSRKGNDEYSLRGSGTVVRVKDIGIPDVDAYSFVVQSSNMSGFNQKGDNALDKELYDRQLKEENNKSNNENGSANPNSSLSGTDGASSSNSENKSSTPPSSNSNNSNQVNQSNSLPRVENKIQELGIDKNKEDLVELMTLGSSFVSGLIEDGNEKKINREAETEKYYANQRKIIYENIDSANANNINSIYKVGFAYLYLKDYKNAELWFNKLLQLAPIAGNYAIGELERAKVFEIPKKDRLARLEKALEYYYKAAELGNELAAGKLMIMRLGIGTDLFDIYWKNLYNDELIKEYENHYYFYKSDIYPYSKIVDQKIALDLANQFLKKEFYLPVKVFRNYSDRISVDRYNKNQKAHKLLSQGKNDECFRYFKETADEFYLNSIRMVAYCYINGIGTNQDAEKAIYYYELAAILGDYYSMDLLSEIYTNGSVTDSEGYYLNRGKYWEEKKNEYDVIK